MKTRQRKRRIQITLLLSAVVILTNVVIFSCQKEEFPKRSTKDSSQLNSLKNDDCSTQCIQVGGPYVEVTDHQHIPYGVSDKETRGKDVDIIYYNTETDFVIKVRSTAGWSNLLIDGKPQWSGSPVLPGHWEMFSRPLDIDWKACDPIKFKLTVTGFGGPASFLIDYNLIGICGGDCQPNFYGEAVSCGPEREVVYTYIPGEDFENISIQGDLLDFKGEDASIEVIGAELKTTQWSLEEEGMRHVLIGGNVSKCEPIRIKIKWRASSYSRVITGKFVVSSEDGTELAPAIEGLECPKN